MAESFNYLALESAACGRPFVGSRAIAFTPARWTVNNVNDPQEIAEVAERILRHYRPWTVAARKLAERVAARQNAGCSDLLAELLL
jgi:glycosyltransferase involved in cell wall biosynthesis